MSRPREQSLAGLEARIVSQPRRSARAGARRGCSSAAAGCTSVRRSRRPTVYSRASPSCGTADRTVHQLNTHARGARARSLRRPDARAATAAGQRAGARGALGRRGRRQQTPAHLILQADFCLTLTRAWTRCQALRRPSRGASSAARSGARGAGLAPGPRAAPGASLRAALAPPAALYASYTNARAPGPAFTSHQVGCTSGGGRGCPCVTKIVWCRSALRRGCCSSRAAPRAGIKRALVPAAGMMKSNDDECRWAGSGTRWPRS